MKFIKLNMKALFILCFLSFFFKGNAQELHTLIGEALANNPKIKKFELQHRIASEKVNEVQTLPNTEFGVGYFASEPETRTGARAAAGFFSRVSCAHSHVPALSGLLLSPPP